jgi:arylsulfatase
MIDIMATVVDVGGAAYPKGKIQPMEGVSLQPAFSGRALKRSSPIFWEHEENRAVREGRWKLVSKGRQPWELYDIETDRSEQTDLAAKDAGRVKAMAAAWDRWAARANVLPLGGWRARGRGKNTATGSTAARFALKSGDLLKGNAAPAVVGRAFTITARFDTAADTVGVIVAQGGLQQGYSLFVQDGRLKFTLRTTGQMSEVSLPIAAGMHTVTAALTEGNELRLQMDGATATAPAKGKILVQPVDGLAVGQDDAGAVGPYKAPFAFTGTISSVEITR